VKGSSLCPPNTTIFAREAMSPSSNLSCSSIVAVDLEVGAVGHAATGMKAGPSTCISSRSTEDGSANPVIESADAVSNPSSNLNLVDGASGEAKNSSNVSLVDGASGDAKKDGARSCTRRRILCCGSCLTCSLGLLAVLLLLLWPRCPTWDVKEMIISPETVDGLLSSFTNPDLNGSQTFTMDTHVQINNSNYVSAFMSEAHFTAEYDSQVVAEVTVEPMPVPGRSHVIAVAHARTTITPELSKILFAAVIPSFHLRVKVVGTTLVKVTSLFGLKVQAKLTCWVDVNVLALAQDSNEMVVRHECTYNIGF